MFAGSESIGIIFEQFWSFRIQLAPISDNIYPISNCFSKSSVERQYHRISTKIEQTIIRIEANWVRKDQNCSEIVSIDSKHTNIPRCTVRTLQMHPKVPNPSGSDSTIAVYSLKKIIAIYQRY